MASELAKSSRSPVTDPRLLVPSAEVWATMSEEAKARFEQDAYDALNGDGDVWVMSESTRHFRPKANAYRDLGDLFGRTGRRVFLACELGVMYPGEEVFSPDLIAVVDVADPERDRDSWRVPDEGRGIDFALELRNKGKEQKDLDHNLRKYARLGIPEYFTFDCRKRVLRGFRLSGTRAYKPIVPQGGHVPSDVLNLELAVEEGGLRFFTGVQPIPTSLELIGRLQHMVDQQHRNIEQAERQRIEAERQRTEAERQRTEATDQLRRAHRTVAEQIIGLLSERSIALTQEQRQTVMDCQDMQQLLAWFRQAMTAPSAKNLLTRT